MLELLLPGQRNKELQDKLLSQNFIGHSLGLTVFDLLKNVSRFLAYLLLIVLGVLILSSAFLSSTKGFERLLPPVPCECSLISATVCVLC